MAAKYIDEKHEYTMTTSMIPSQKFKKGLFAFNFILSLQLILLFFIVSS